MKKVVMFITSLFFFTYLISCEQISLKDICIKIKNGNNQDVINELNNNPQLLNVVEVDKTKHVRYNVFIASVFSRNKEVFDYLIEKKVDINACLPKPNDYPIAFSCAGVEDPYFLEQIIKMGFDPDRISNNGKTMLHYALENNCLPVATTLAKNMRSMEKWRNEKGENALIFSALASGRAASVDFVIKNNFVIDAYLNDGTNAVECLFLQKKAYLQQIDMLLLLMNKQPSMVRNRQLSRRCFEYGWANPALLLAIQRNGYDILNEKDSSGDTVLTYLLKMKYYAIIKGLMENGLRITDFNKSKETVDEYMVQQLHYTLSEVQEFHDYMKM